MTEKGDRPRNITYYHAVPAELGQTGRTEKYQDPYSVEFCKEWQYCSNFQVGCTPGGTCLGSYWQTDWTPTNNDYLAGQVCPDP
jgi:hypothetical protein